ncbi:hypothetical protein Cph01nite_09920 [Cellulomonas phragmiteti]|uniref:Integral membrane protein n=1 Tax=Cellulomonas phragmiteti TaxID=478780 RepID=A0ABQ4DIR0_9CELL|nr:hypothetical protein Cph01nite_09920 [Cellulomonas phragmiteti]
MGLVLVVVGVTVLLTNRGDESLGWFAYAPLAEATYSPGLVVTSTHLWAAGAAVVGLVATSGAVGFIVGRRDRGRGA